LIKLLLNGWLQVFTQGIIPAPNSDPSIQTSQSKSKAMKGSEFGAGISIKNWGSQRIYIIYKKGYKR
jgi:hypothetical protein